MFVQSFCTSVQNICISVQKFRTPFQRFCISTQNSCITVHKFCTPFQKFCTSRQYYLTINLWVINQKINSLKAFKKSKKRKSHQQPTIVSVHQPPCDADDATIKQQHLGYGNGYVLPNRKRQIVYIGYVCVHHREHPTYYFAHQ